MSGKRSKGRKEPKGRRGDDDLRRVAIYLAWVTVTRFMLGVLPRLPLHHGGPWY